MSLIVRCTLVVICLHVSGRSSGWCSFYSPGLFVELHTQALVPNYRSGHSIREWTDSQNRSAQRHANLVVFHGMEYSVWTLSIYNDPEIIGMSLLLPARPLLAPYCGHHGLTPELPGIESSACVIGSKIFLSL